ncbi:mannose-1-phosphate guanylyltransferase/mannose-6-phosphate isomerase [Idiomarina seosinensis]|uniref:mannose-1-phosphate guanylyltransferase/mannose-6-phosphate isomerase n=1 Tax=Idiomarina seosinensis TaxID=281739 RepID=UPI00384FC2E2
MSDQSIIPVILSGGSGTRLWPLSRQAYPKQFLKLTDDKTLFQNTVLRAKAFGPPIVVCNEEHRFLVAEQLRQINVKAHAIILEPCARNTAGAIALAAAYLQKSDETARMLIMPADHVMQHTDTFTKTVRKADEIAVKSGLCTFGVAPTHPETGYGYIKPALFNDSGISQVQAFVEKPNQQKAQLYIAANYLWNSGIFLFPVAGFLNELAYHQPGLVEQIKVSVSRAQKDLDFIRPEPDAFAKIEAVSIDYALMEKTNNAFVVKLSVPWSDVGNFASLWQTLEKDSDNNAISGDVIALESHDNLLMAENQLVTTIGVSDIAVIATKDAVLVASKASVQKVKKIVETLQQSNRAEQQLHRDVHRPWGSYDSVDRGDRYQVKHIRVKPGASLSLQRHKHRSEHWVVVKGIADVIVGDVQKQVLENESVFIPAGQKHRLSNCQQESLDIIEIQTGSYLDEDDIERFDDDYGRD